MQELNFRKQREQVADLLAAPNPDGLTRMQIARCLGIERGSICRRVAELRDSGRIWVIRKGICPITKRRAEFLTCNKQVAMAAPAIPMAKKELSGKLF